MGGKAKIELLLELKNKMKTGLSAAKDKVNNTVKEMKSKLSDLKNHHVAMFSAMREEIPLFDKALKLLGNPYVLLTAGLVAIGAMLYSATGKAADFNHEFLPIANLNLDKSRQELAKYKDTILDTAFAVGTEAKATAKAFYDVQSATNYYGNDAKQIVASVGRFSVATGSNLNDTINSTTKAMKAFKLGVNDIDSYLESNAKTVQVGITTFEELARVQTEYAGSAAGAGQTVDTANKIFAAFTSIAKDSTTAATMTKTAFLGLTQSATIKGLKDIGVSMYDAKGNMRDLSEVLKEVSGRFKTMSPKAIDETINKIGGPEGLRNLFVKLKTGADDFFSTLENFDNSKFNIDDALKNAQGDFNTLKEIVGNRLNVAMTKLGDKILPTALKGLELINKAVVWATNNFDDIKTAITYLGTAVMSVIAVVKLWTLANWALSLSLDAIGIGLIIAAIAALVTAVVWCINHTKELGETWQQLKVIMSASWDQVVQNISLLFKRISLYWNYAIDSIKLGWDETVAGIKYKINLLKLNFMHFGQYIAGIFGNVGKAIGLALKGDFSEARKALSAKITTKASVEIEELKNTRKAEVQGFVDKKAELLVGKYKQYTNDSREYLTATVKNLKDINGAKEKISQGVEKDKTTDEPTSDSTVPAGSVNSNNPVNNNSSTTNSTSNAVNNIVGSATQVKSINIQIGAIHKGDLVANQTESKEMSLEQMADKFGELILRTIRNIETSYA